MTAPRCRIARAGAWVRRVRLALAGAAFGALIGCASPEGDGLARQPPIGSEGERPQVSAIAVDDPLETLNRNTYAFNALVDELVLLPVVDAYKFVVPLVFRDRISDFFSNLDDLLTFANQVLQLKMGDAGRTALRFGTNTMLGMGGFVDIATAMGLPKYQEDFGQTLGFWGVGPGPYLVVPVLGPSSVRDVAGRGADWAALFLLQPFDAVGAYELGNPAVIGVEAVNARYVQPFRYYESGSPFEYDLVRFLYTKKREVEIGEGPSWPDWQLPDFDEHPAPARASLDNTRP